jgi:hypothetical protein
MNPPENIAGLESARNARPYVNQPLISIKKIWRTAKRSRSEQSDHAVVNVPIQVSNRKGLTLKSFTQCQIEGLIHKANIQEAVTAFNGASIA